MKTLIKHEFKIQNKIYNLIKYLIIFFIFCTFSITLINSHENIQLFGTVFSVICIPLAFIGLSNNLTKPDIEDGTLEAMLTTIEPIIIILTKYLALCVCTLISLAITLPITTILYNVDIQSLAALIFSGILLITLSAALSILTSSIQGYFRANTNFLSILIMPLIIPTIIISGLLIQTPGDIHLAAIMLGINLIIIPPVLYLSGYLLENIYNI